MRRQILSVFWVCCIGGAGWGVEARAQIRDEGAPASALGSADALVASATGASAIFFNPAGINRLQQFSVETGYNFSNDLGGHSFTANSVDSKTNPALGMGLAYTHVISTLSGKERVGNTIRGVLATGYRSKELALSVGVGGRYSGLIVGEVDSPSQGAIDDVEYVTVDAGIMVELNGVFNIGVVGRNLIDSKHVAEAPRTVAFGLGGQFTSFQISADLSMDLQSRDEPVLAWAAGFQALLDQGLIFRAGYDGGGLSGHNRISGGFGYVSQAMSIDMSIRQGIENTGDTAFSASLKVFIP